MKRRGSGVLLHISSLPSRFGIGDLGPEAYRFADFLAEAKQHYWQILPLNPTDPLHGNSPYRSVSAFAFNPWLISPELMVNEGLMEEKELAPLPKSDTEKVDFVRVMAYKNRLFELAYERFKGMKDKTTYTAFYRDHGYWLDDFALFRALKNHFSNTEWAEWPKDIRDRDAKTLASYRERLADTIEKEKFLQCLFIKQWRQLKSYCSERNIAFFGDVPIYVAYDSADVWTHPNLFKLDEDRKPLFVSGVPPDYFSETGQLWGNPVYRWDVMKKNKFAWWIERIRHNIDLFDFVRIDHFRGLVGYWQVAFGEKTAINGEWVEAPAMDFLNQLRRQLDDLPIVAEDLGLITKDVQEVMEHFGLPGMRVLQFAFSDEPSTNLHLPHNLDANCILFTGTHDNNTVQGWFANDTNREERGRLYDYFGRKVSRKSLHWDMIRLAMMSVANTVILPMQDLLGLGQPARMNRPFKNEGNWLWQLREGQVSSELCKRLARITTVYGRT